MSLLRLDPQFKASFDGLREATAVVQDLAKQCPIKVAYLFGSAATEQNHANSDLDILVIVPEGADLPAVRRSAFEVSRKIRATDWIFKTEAQFATESEIGGVCRVAMLTGKRIDIICFGEAL